MHFCHCEMHTNINHVKISFQSSLILNSFYRERAKSSLRLKPRPLSTRFSWGLSQSKELTTYFTSISDRYGCVLSVCELSGKFGRYGYLPLLGCGPIMVMSWGRSFVIETIHIHFIFKYQNQMRRFHENRGYIYCFKIALSVFDSSHIMVCNTSILLYKISTNCTQNENYKMI